MTDKLKMQIDIEKPIQVYKVLMSEVSGYFIDVAAENAEEAMQYAESNKKSGMYKPYDKQIVDISPVEVVISYECGGCLTMFKQFTAKQWVFTGKGVSFKSWKWNEKNKIVRSSAYGRLS